MRRFAAVILGTAALLGALATPASAVDPGAAVNVVVGSAGDLLENVGSVVETINPNTLATAANSAGS
ncbi:hypothetical protein [Streptomyces syringium]|uniref:hypothetical protein n=1 Tax=Streptomyces syringium TaxID=76729 RepID=UPI00345423E7